LLEKNGCASSGKHTHHINIHYFFVADQVASKGINTVLPNWRDDC
jgi:hypothetical protein